MRWFNIGDDFYIFIHKGYSFNLNLTNEWVVVFNHGDDLEYNRLKSFILFCQQNI